MHSYSMYRFEIKTYLQLFLLKPQAGILCSKYLNVGSEWVSVLTRDCDSFDHLAESF